MMVLDPLGAANAMLQRGLKDLELGDLVAAETLFEQSLLHVPDNYIALQNLAFIFANRGALKDAEAFLKRVRYGDQTPQMLFDLGKIQIALGKTEEACLVMRKALERDPSSIKIKERLASVENMLNNRVEATLLYKDLVAESPADASVLRPYAKLIWADYPEEAIMFLETGLKCLSDPAGRRDLLSDLILYKEIEARREMGLSPYHVADLDHMQIQHCLPELVDLCQVCSSLLSSNSADYDSRARYAQALHAQGDFASSQKQFSNLSAKDIPDISAQVHFDDDFTDTVASATLEDLSAGLPKIDYNQHQDFGDRPVIVVSSDYRYFVHFTRPLVLSLERYAAGSCLHLHIMDASVQQLKDAVAWSTSLDTITCAISSEQTGLDRSDPENAPAYYHAIRFIRFIQLTAIYRGNLWMIDADALANNNLDVLIGSKEDWDVALRVRPGRLEPWNVVSAGLVGMKDTLEAHAFYTYVAAYIAQVWRQGVLPWGIDQMAIYSALLRFDPKRLRLLMPDELDVDAQPDSIFWFLSGRSKALLAELHKHKNDLRDKLSDREYRYAEAYMTYLS